MADADHATVAFVKLLENISSQLSAVTDQIRDVRERMIRIESNGAAERLKTLEEELDEARNRLTVLETRGQSLMAIVGSGSAILTSLITAAILFVFRG